MPAPYKDDKGNDVKLGFSNVHYFAAGGTLYGSQVQMGYQYEGKTYDAKHQHVAGFDTCLGCHDQHSLEVKVEACAECHQGVATVDDLKKVREPSSAKDYDGDGNKEEGVALKSQACRKFCSSPSKHTARKLAALRSSTMALSIHTSWALMARLYPNWTPRLLESRL